MIGPTLYCGDPHGEFAHIIRAATLLKASAVVLLGDLEPARPLHVELAPIRSLVWFIHGNHDADTDEVWARVWLSEMADRNVHGRVVTLPNGTRLAGLGGVFRQSVWHPGLVAAMGGISKYGSREEHARVTPRQDRWHGGPPRKHSGTIYPEEVNRLADMRADVLVTHEAPGYHPHGVELLDSLAQQMGVKVTVHGHHHDALDSSARWAGQGFRSFGVGLRGITAISQDGTAEVIVRDERDHVRGRR